MLDVDTNRYKGVDDGRIDSPSDTVSTVLGILKQLRLLNDRYIVLGELRADLMDIVTENADQDLREIYNIDYQDIDYSGRERNAYLTLEEYYSVINNCNLFINKVDTTLMVGGRRILLQEYAVVKGIRAWTYLQLVLNYGKACYITEPILTVEDMNKYYKESDLQEIADLLIKDIAPYEFLEYPAYIVSDRYQVFPISFLLGDLYLWKQDYENAALHYHNLISGKGPARRLVPSDRFRWLLDPEGAELGSVYTNSWSSIFSNPTSGDAYTLMKDYIDRPVSNRIRDLVEVKRTGTSAQYKLAPSKVAMDNWSNSPYTFYIEASKTVLNRLGDLRGKITHYNNSPSGASYNVAVSEAGDTIPYINKYDQNTGFLYRVPTLYLRFAEAINQLGKPSVAFAVLKYGLNENILADPKRVNLDEVGGENKPSYLDFRFLTQNEVDNTIGIHARGSGSVEQDTLNYILGVLTEKTDSINRVEELILDELALETAFEGNRFHDLMRFAIRRGSPEIMTTRVAKKNPSAASKLEEEKYWYLPSY
jgi:hypothetical protein